MIDSALETAAVDGAGRPTMFPGEVQQAVQGRAFLCTPDVGADKKTRDTLTLTTHRLIWTRAEGARPQFLRLEGVLGVSVSGGFLGKPVKVTLQLGSGAPPGWQGKQLLARVHEKDVLSRRLQEVVAKRLWALSPLPSPAQLVAMAHAAALPGVAEGVAAAASAAATSQQQQQQQQQQQGMMPGMPGTPQSPQPQQQQQPEKEFSVYGGGITGIIRKEEAKSREADAALSCAFQDIDSLLMQAKTLVEIADRIKVARERETRADAAAGVQDAKEQAEFDSYLAQLGISNPVTRESCGSDFHQALARELAQMCVPLMQRKGPMITLPDLYCIYNRARRADLVSPEDLMTACQLLEKLQLPVRLHRFDSGVLVVRSVAMDDAVVSKQIARLITENGPLTALDISRLRNVSLALAREEIATAERLQVLCRDETYEGVVFYVNFFNDYPLPDHLVATPSS